MYQFMLIKCIIYQFACYNINNFISLLIRSNVLKQTIVQSQYSCRSQTILKCHSHHTYQKKVHGLTRLSDKELLDLICLFHITSVSNWFFSVDKQHIDREIILVDLVSICQILVLFVSIVCRGFKLRCEWLICGFFFYSRHVMQY